MPLAEGRKEIPPLKEVAAGRRMSTRVVETLLILLLCASHPSCLPSEGEVLRKDIPPLKDMFGGWMMSTCILYLCEYMKNKIIPYNPRLKEIAKRLRKQGIIGEILLWKQLQHKAFGVEFHRQVPMLDYIVDFYCHELMLAIELDGLTHNSEEAELLDEHRQQRLEKCGVVFLRLNDAEVKKNMQGVVRIIENTIYNLQQSKV